MSTGDGVVHNTGIATELGGNVLDVQAGATLDVQASATEEVEGTQNLESGAALNVKSGANVNVKSGGTVNVESGGHFQIAGVNVTASAADINNGLGSSAAENVNTANAGTVYTGSVMTKVNGDGVHNRFTLTLTNFALGLSGDNVSKGVGGKFFTLAAGVWAINVTALSIGVTIADGSATAQTPVIGVGTVVASGAVVVLSGTATFQNIVAGAAVTNCSGTAKVINTIPTANVPLIIATGDSHDLYLNTACAWADIAAASALTATGTIVIDSVKLA